jgi:hypothetical protein
MSKLHDAWLAKQRARWMRPNAHLYMRPDAHRFAQPDLQRWLRPDWTRYVQPAFQPFYQAPLEGKVNFNPSQPRVPKGSPGGGQWTDEDGGSGEDGTGDPSQADALQSGFRIAQTGFGTLIAEIPVRGGRQCVYKFGAFSVIVPGAANFRCIPRAHWSAVTHGRLLNDN